MTETKIDLCVLSDQHNFGLFEALCWWVKTTHNYQEYQSECLSVCLSISKINILFFNYFFVQSCVPTKLAVILKNIPGTLWKYYLLVEVALQFGWHRLMQYFSYSPMIAVVKSSRKVLMVLTWFTSVILCGEQWWCNGAVMLSGCLVFLMLSAHFRKVGG